MPGAESLNDRTQLESGTFREKAFLRRRRHAPSGARAASARLKKNFEAGTLWDELHVSLSPPGAMLWGAHEVVTAAGEGVTGGVVWDNVKALSARMMPCQRHIALEISRRRRQRPCSAPVARSGSPPPPSYSSPRAPAHEQPRSSGPEAPAASPQTPQAPAEVGAKEQGMGGSVRSTGASCEEQASFSDPEYLDDFDD
jgi:hypothetical protein